MFRNFDQKLAGDLVSVENDGHTVKLEIDSKNGNLPVARGSALADNTYKFKQLHFHWHSDATSGSEHAINGRKYALEVRSL